MTESCTSIDELDDFALASQPMAATACAAALARVRDILGTRASAAGLDDIAYLAGMTRGIADCLDSGAQALADDDHDCAVFEHARALVLMNALPLAAARQAKAASASVAPASDQKSGITG
jgi:hypothetical protein